MIQQILHSDSIAQILERKVHDCFEINGKQMTKKLKLLRPKNYSIKIKSPSIISANFKSIFVPENNKNQN